MFKVRFPHLENLHIAGLFVQSPNQNFGPPPLPQAFPGVDVEDIGSLIGRAGNPENGPLVPLITWLEYSTGLLKRNNHRNGVIKSDILVLLHEP